MQYLKNIKNIILCAGHGEGDPGAVNGLHTEEAQTARIVNRMSGLLQDKLSQNGYNLVIVPHSLGLESSISWINQRYKDVFENWVIEIHRDSAAGLSWKDASTRCGCYYYQGDSNSQAISDKIRDILKRETKNPHTWSRGHHARGFPLGWIEQTIPVAHLLELGFMQGDNTDDHLYWLADIAAQAIFETLTGKNLKSNNQSNMNYNQILLDTENNINWSRFKDFDLNEDHHRRLYSVEGRPYQVINSLLNRTEKIKKEPLKGFELDLEKVKKINSKLTKTDYIFLQYEVEKNPENTINKLTDWGYTQAIENEQLKTEYKEKIQKMEEEIKELESKASDEGDGTLPLGDRNYHDTIRSIVPYFAGVGSLLVTVYLSLPVETQNKITDEISKGNFQVAFGALLSALLPVIITYFLNNQKNKRKIEEEKQK